MSFLRRARFIHSLPTAHLAAHLAVSLAVILAVLGLATSARAATATATSGGARPLDGTLTIDDQIDPGNLVLTFTLNAVQGDIRGFLAHVADESLIPGLSVVGFNNRSSQFREDHIGKASKSQGLGQPGTACPCDFGLKFPARTGQSVSFTLTHASVDLTVDLFYGQDFAVKAAKIQTSNETGRGRSKGIKSAILQGRVLSPIPEPTTAVLMFLGLGGLSVVGRARRN